MVLCSALRGNPWQSLPKCFAAAALALDRPSHNAGLLKVLDPRSAEHIEIGSIWAYVGDDRDVLFR